MESEEFAKIVEQGELLIAKGEYLEARDLLEGFINDNEVLDDEILAKVFLLLGKSTVFRGEFEISLLHLKTAQRKAKKPSRTFVEAMRVEGIVYLERGNFETALDLFSTSLDLARKIGFKKAICAGLNNIAIVHTYRGELETATEIYDEALSAAVEFEDKEESAKILNNMAEIFAKRGRYDLAYENYRRSLLLCKELGDKHLQATLLNNISEIFKARGDFEKSIEFLQQSYDLYKEIGLKRGIGVVQSNLGELYWLDGDLRKATETINQAIEIHQEIGIEDEVYWHSLLLLTGVFTDRGYYQQAEELLSKAESLNNRIQSDLFAAEIFYVRGYLESPGKGKGNLGNAKSAYMKALAITENEKLGLLKIWINASLGLAEVNIGEYMASLEEKNLQEAEERLDLIHTMAQDESQIPILCQVLQLQGLLAIARLKHDEALEKFEEARKIAEQRGLTFLAIKSRENYDRAVNLRMKSKKMLEKESEVDEVFQYVKERVREVQRMIQTFGGG